ncbi:MAG: UDP-N-acetylmuramoyl-L-alanyl-D-glutamate--2,6-diaminopimelate ligase [Chromatiales bacterium]|nr:MAG: UDP-N-acetylmuramoyl-L-alanyl-D-glutamate--2,6-diaminopimelate ligase [Chromatiales bacterium]
MTAGCSILLTDLFRDCGADVPARRVTGLSASSRRVTPGALFLACAGQRHHGLRYLGDALAAGAVAVAWEPGPGIAEPAVPDDIVAFAVPGLGGLQGRLADRYYDAPSRELAVTGITGTNGKTTVAWLVVQALEASGNAAAYSGTLGFGRLPALQATALTTPGSVEVHHRLRQFADAGAAHAVLEVSSHALDQGRVNGVRFKVAALTNISRDHLDYHGDMARYSAAKARLFLDTAVPTAVINLGDARGRQLRDRLPTATDAITVALVAGGDAPPAVRLIGRLTATRCDGIGLALSGDFGTASIDSPLWGECNAENLVMAAGILLGHGLPLDAAAAALSRAVAPPGRLERVSTKGRGPAVIVDFAHTPDALSNALKAVRSHSRGSVWCVFGCGGERDAGKRAPMGAIAASLADHVLLTDDNPRGEDPDAIVAQIRAGIADQQKVRIIRDRAEAIRFAVDAAGDSDAVLIAGKGHEAVQIVAGESHAFSDQQMARDALGQAE